MRACPQCLTVYESDPEYCAFDGEQTVGVAEGVDPLAGLTLDGYRLEQRLGVGGTGCVYRSTNLDSGQDCAIKLLFGEMATDKDLAERFRREAEAMKHIDHPNVVSVLECATSAEGLTYLVMEFVPGRTLKQVVEQEAPLAPGRVGRLAEQLVAGMAEAHRLGYVHRDLKPSNVMISGNPGAETTKILDFGIVASLHERQQDNRLTKTGYIVGTPTYMAPEQIDPHAVTPQVDVYALGVMIYEMLAGKPPFTGTLEQILVAKMTSPAPKLDTGSELGGLVMRLLATSPEDRPPTALHVSAELARTTLLSVDPATEKARVPDLAPLGVVGFGQATALVMDELKRTDEGPWPGPQTEVDAALDDDTPADDYSEFDEEVPTRATMRADTVVDAQVLDSPSDTALQPVVQFPDDSDNLPAEVPTRVAEFALPSFDGDDSGPRTDEQPLWSAPGNSQALTESSPPATSPVTPLRSASAVSLDDFPASFEDGQSTLLEDDLREQRPVETSGSLLSSVPQPGDSDSDEVGYADTRISPAHLEDYEGPVSFPTRPANEPQPLNVGEPVTALSLDPDALPPLSQLQGLGDVDDPGDGDTAFDLSLEQVESLVEPQSPEHNAETQSVGPAPTRRWWLGVVFTVLLVGAAVLTYRVLSPAEDVIQIPPVPNSGLVE